MKNVVISINARISNKAQVKFYYNSGIVMSSAQRLSYSLLSWPSLIPIASKMYLFPRGERGLDAARYIGTMHSRLDGMQYYLGKELSKGRRKSLSMENKDRYNA